MIIDFLSKAKEKLRYEENWNSGELIGLVPKRKVTARNCPAPNWSGEESKSFVMQCEGKAMMSLERLWNSMVLK